MKNPLAPAEHTGGVGVANELFELGLESFMVSSFFKTDHAKYLAPSLAFPCWEFLFLLAFSHLNSYVFKCYVM